MADETPAPLSDAEIAERVAKATPGPWALYGHAYVTSDPHHNHIATCDLLVDAAFIAAARTDIPCLLATLAARDAEIERLKSQVAIHETWRQDAEFRLVREHEDRMREYADDGATLAAYREIVVAVAADALAGDDMQDWCVLCQNAVLGSTSYTTLQHTADCPVTRARTLLAASKITVRGSDNVQDRELIKNEDGHD